MLPLQNIISQTLHSTLFQFKLPNIERRAKYIYIWLGEVQRLEQAKHIHRIYIIDALSKEQLA